MIHKLVLTICFALTCQAVLFASAKYDHQTLTVEIEKLHEEFKDSLDDGQLCTRYVHYLAKYFSYEINYTELRREIARALIKAAILELKHDSVDYNSINLLEGCLNISEFENMEPLEDHIFVVGSETINSLMFPASLAFSSSKFDAQVSQAKAIAREWESKANEYFSAINTMKSQHVELKHNTEAIIKYVDALLLRLSEATKALQDAQEAMEAVGYSSAAGRCTVM